MSQSRAFKALGLALALLLGATFAARAAEAPPLSVPDSRIQVCFTPGGDCTGRIVAALDGARRQVLVQAYSFTSWPIARALVRAYRRGVEVRMIMDAGALSDYSRTAFDLFRAHIPVLVDGRERIAHNKVMVIDGHEVITGSFNFTRAAQKDNAENLLLIDDQTLAAEYAANWRRHADHSLPWDGRRPRR